MVDTRRCKIPVNSHLSVADEMSKTEEKYKRGRENNKNSSQARGENFQNEGLSIKLCINCNYWSSNCF